MMNLTKRELAQYFDHTMLKAFATTGDIERLCREAKAEKTYAVCVNPCFVKKAKECLRGSEVKVCSVIDFPLGAKDLKAKEFELKEAIANGANEVDYVLNIGKVKEHDYAYIKEEMQTMTKAAHDLNAVVKVIFENCYLTKEEIKEVALIAAEVKPDFIKTSSGFGTGGATVEDVRLMAKTVGPDVKVKAAGGIRDLESCLKMIAAGASRIGVSASLKILAEIQE